MVAPINRLSIILGKTLAQMARGLLQGVIILVLAMALIRSDDTGQHTARLRFAAAGRLQLRRVRHHP